MKNLSPVAIPAFSAEDYHEVMGLLPAEEQDRLPFEHYIENAEAHMEELRQTGVVTRRIQVTPGALLFWCERHAQPVTRESISLFAAAQLAEEWAAEPPVAPPLETGEEEA